MPHLLPALLAQANEPNVDGIVGMIYGLLAAFALVWLAIWLVVTVTMIVAGWRIFEKAGQPGWSVLIPFYNIVILMRVCGLSGWWALAPLILVIPVLGWIAYLVWVCWINHRLAQNFGKPVGFTVGLVLLAPIFWCILGFGNAKYLPVAKQA